MACGLRDRQERLPIRKSCFEQNKNCVFHSSFNTYPMTNHQEYNRKERILLNAAESIGPRLITLLGMLCQYRVTGTEHFDMAQTMGKGVILTLWHGRMLLPIYHLRHRGIVSLVSLHRDGEFIARIVQRLGYVIRRGSPKEGGMEGFKAILRDLNAGKTISMFPDGPTGPCYTVRDGVLHLARLTGAPIVPMTYSANPCWRFNSWDRFMLMQPVSRAVVAFGKPLFLPRRMKIEKEIDNHRLRIRSALMELLHETDRAVSIDTDLPGETS